MIGEGVQRRKLKLKLFQLLGDLILNDDSIENDGDTVRKFVAGNNTLLTALLETVKNTNLR